MGRPEHELAHAASPAGVLGASLRALRHAAGLSQSELATLSGCAPATVGQVERARFLPSGQLIDQWEQIVAERGQLVPLWERAVIEAHRRRDARAAARR